MYLEPKAIYLKGNLKMIISEYMAPDRCLTALYGDRTTAVCIDIPGMDLESAA